MDTFSISSSFLNSFGWQDQINIFYYYQRVRAQFLLFLAHVGPISKPCGAIINIYLTYPIKSYCENMTKPATWFSFHDPFIIIRERGGDNHDLISLQPLFPRKFIIY